MFLKPFNAPSRNRRASRGFTLIELVVVVLIIGITAALATPTMANQVRERRARDAAQRIALLYSNARMRALGRGSAVVVRYRKASGFTVYESIQGATAAAAQNAASVTCAPQPGLGCLSNNWGDPETSRLLVTLQPDSNLTVAAKEGTTVRDNMDICFTPLGRSFISFDATPPSTPMVGATTIDVQRTGNGKGLLRTIAVLPNGMARLGL